MVEHQRDRAASAWRGDSRACSRQPAVLGLSRAGTFRCRPSQDGHGSGWIRQTGRCTVTPILDEYSLEARLGLEAALRRNALPPTGGETVTDSQWLLDTPPEYRNEVCRTDRALSALLSGDHLAAARHVETAGPVGAALICLRVAVQAQRLLAQDSATDSSNELRADHAARYLAALTQCVAI